MLAVQNQVDLIKNQVVKAFNIVDGLSPSSEEDGPWEEAMWQLGVVNDSIKSLQGCMDEAIYEAQKIKDALDEIGTAVSKKIENPYSQYDFVSFLKKPNDTYLSSF